MIDHTLLKPDATQEQIAQLCQEAKTHRFATVCVNGAWTSLAAELLHESGVGVATVIGFPLGAATTRVKVFEAYCAIDAGATELDMVLHVGALKSGLLSEVYTDVRQVVEAAAGRALVKVILETGSLTEEEKITACILCDLAGADYVKTSTGFGTGGATEADVLLMNQYTRKSVRVKASGGVRTAEAAHAMITAGASRLGTSSGVQLVTGGEGQGY
ncbi:deoxyribose-phosphate aldolase [Paenibacillus daejeonensis]|uniref:deoxyribose-phosphate aldolase n=1 Tax=Paenibacillus daejeonensis TaxID=135193 RepID=UPI0004780F92|nr:deoxyribose-phosphate aldolase [Paenibacillus daejeonensis]